jgi:argininosuccinate synthase
MKALLAFSGGLDTSYCIPYLLDKGYEVVTVTVNTGAFTRDELDDIATRSAEYGAVKHHEVTATDRLYDDFVTYIIKANYLKGGVYPACVGPERVVAAIEIAEIAKQENIMTVVHGSTGAGNDQVRFDLALHTLIPGVKILAPIRENALTRAEEVDYLKTKGIEVSLETKEYSINVGLLGTTIGGKETLDTKSILPEHIFPYVKPIDETPDTAESMTITFEQGAPLAVNGSSTSGVEMIEILNAFGAKHGYGKDHHIGTTIIGLKGRIGFEAPALRMLIKAHTELEKITLTQHQQRTKQMLGQQYGDMIHDGLYFDPLVQDLEAFLDSVNQQVTGTVTVQLYKGNLTVTSMESKYSLMNSKIGKYGEEAGSWNGRDAEGFCKLYGFDGRNARSTQ